MRVTGMVLIALLCLYMQAFPSVAQTKTAAQAASPSMKVAGWVEFGWLGNPPIKVKVKLDTGAKNSSINAPNFHEFEKDGKRHVSFTLTNNEGHEVEITQPVLRTATIRRAGIGRRQRPVIPLTVCVAGVTSEVEFTMADRSELNYPILIGRSFLAEKLLVDSGRTFLAPGLCNKQ